MSLHPLATYPIPEETQRIARAAFPHGTIYMQVADRLGNIYHDAQFTALFPTRGQPAEAPARLALATLLQFAEGLSDRQAADAVRSRIDWKYALSLELTDPGFDHTVLSEFRTRLVAGQQAEPLLSASDTFLASPGYANVASSTCAAVNARTPRTCWRPFASSIGSSASGRRCALR